ncbi:ABC transporter permease [Enterocloster bolteae]|nr:ABC transporter permease [Enterocloster bolteae]
MTFVILTGGIDLSVGAIIGVSGVLTAMMMINNVNPIIASLISLALCTLIGFATGLVISHIGIPPMVATMGTMTSLRGVAYLITGGTPVFGFDSRYAVIGQGYVGAVPIPVIILVLSFAAGIFFLSKTRHSRYIYGVGGNEEVARLSGISVHRIKAFVYAVSGFCSALAGLVMLGRLNSGQPRAGESYEMDVITAVVLGGVSLTGGVGKISHVVFGVLIIGVLTNGMTMMAVDDYWQRVVKGLVLLLAVGFDRFIQKRQQKSE